MNATEKVEIETTPRDLFTVKRFSARWPAWTEASLRALIYASQDRFASGGRIIVKGNGLEAAGVIVRVSRRVLLDEQAFFRWIAEQQKRTTRKAAA